jgi:hypothetical protein
MFFAFKKCSTLDWRKNFEVFHGFAVVELPHCSRIVPLLQLRPCPPNALDHTYAKANNAR